MHFDIKEADLHLSSWDSSFTKTAGSNKTKMPPIQHICYHNISNNNFLSDMNREIYSKNYVCLQTSKKLKSAGFLDILNKEYMAI